jgi:DNA polymerase III delta prime subunit
MIRDDFLWTEKYRPKTVGECILPHNLKQTFQQFVNDKNVPNLLLCGRAGVGKTSIAIAMLEELQSDYIVVNGSLNGNIDTLRNEIMSFASTVSFSDTRKYVIFDEADYLNPQSTQPALRNFIEEFSQNCGFILTCNFKNRIIEPLHSRCSVVDFKIENKEKPKLANEFFKRTVDILCAEGIAFEEKAIGALITKYFPDWRRVLNELQRYSANGIIDTGILSSIGEESFKTLIEHLKQKSFTNVRKWVGENNDIDSVVLFRKFYDNAYDFLQASSVPQLVLIIGEYQYRAAFVADQEINLVAFFTQVMVDCVFK